MARDDPTLLLRFSGEVGIKARFTRNQFELRLVRNVEDALRSEGIEGTVRRTHDRVFVETSDPSAPEVLSRVVGIQSLASAERRSVKDLDDVVEAGVSLFQERVRGREFAVRARRVGRAELPYGGQDVERALGAALLPLARGVNLDHPEVTVRVELYDGEAFFFPESITGPGGLPLGTQDAAVALVSGGFDSVVAAWLMQKRGVPLEFVFCNLGGASHQLGALRVMKVLAERWSYGTMPRLHAVDFTSVAQEIRDNTETRYWQVILKRLMMRAAGAVAEETGCPALVTGEAVGQVSSQTLQNLAVISQATPHPILRPLAGFNKDEIVALARHIGTAELSAVVGEYCAMVPSRPATAARLEAILREESRIDGSRLEKAVAERTVFALRELTPEVLAIPGLEIDTIPENAVVLDLRSSAAFRGWHYPKALNLEFTRALATWPSISRDSTYVLYCEFGLKSAHLAELMHDAGFAAFNFRGGLRPLIRYAESRGHSGPDLPSSDSSGGGKIG